MKGRLRELLSSEQCLWRAYALHRGSAFGQPSDFSRSKRLRYLFRLRHVKTVLLVVVVDKRTHWQDAIQHLYWEALSNPVAVNYIGWSALQDFYPRIGRTRIQKCPL